VEPLGRAPVPLLRHVALVTGVALLAALLAACGGSSGGSTSTPSPSPSAAASALAASPSPVATLDVSGALVVVHKDGPKRWGLWRVVPRHATEERLTELPFQPFAAEVSPDGRRVAYRGESWKSGLSIAVLDVAAGEVRSVPLASAPLATAGGMTWLASDTLLVSGSPSMRRSGPVHDVLVELDAGTMTFTSFRGLRGSDPSAASAVHKLVYVTARKLRRGPGDPYSYNAERETLRRLDLDRPGRGRYVTSADGIDPDYYAAHRSMEAVDLSPDARYVLTAETGSDTTVTYSIRDARWGACAMTMLAPGVPLSAWSLDDKVAFSGSSVLGSQNSYRVWVFDVRSGVLTRTQGGSGRLTWVSGLAWSHGGDLGIGVSRGMGKKAEDLILVAPGGRLDRLTEVTSGTLPVWVD
jgi:hypothetical protein